MILCHYFAGCLWSMLFLVTKLQPSVLEKISEESNFDSLTKPNVTDPSCPWLYNTVGCICVILPHLFASIYFTPDSWLCLPRNCKLSAGRGKWPMAPMSLVLVHNRFRVPWPEVAELDHFIKDVAGEYCRKIILLLVSFDLCNRTWAASTRKILASIFWGKLVMRRHIWAFMKASPTHIKQKPHNAYLSLFSPDILIFSFYIELDLIKSPFVRTFSFCHRFATKISNLGDNKAHTCTNCTQRI